MKFQKYAGERGRKMKKINQKTLENPKNRQIRNTLYITIFEKNIIEYYIIKYIVLHRIYKNKNGSS